MSVMLLNSVAAVGNNHVWRPGLNLFLDIPGLAPMADNDKAADAKTRHDLSLLLSFIKAETNAAGFLLGVAILCLEFSFKSLDTTTNEVITSDAYRDPRHCSYFDDDATFGELSSYLSQLGLPFPAAHGGPDRSRCLCGTLLNR